MSTSPETYTKPQAPAPAPSLLDTAVDMTTRRQSIASEAAARLGVAPNKVCDLLRNVWKTSIGQPDLTDQEMFTGMSMIARFDLDPIAKEVYVARDSKGRLLTIVGIDGWIKAVHRTDHFDGFEQEEGYDDKGKLIWIETRIYSKKWSRPAVYRARAEEYAKLGGIVAKQIPVHMLKLFSFRHAARFFTALGGVSTQEEAEWRQSSDADDRFTATPPTDLNALAATLRAKTDETGEVPRSDPETAALPTETPPVVAAPSEGSLESKLNCCKLKRDCDSLAAKFPGNASVAAACESRWQELKADRGENSNKPTPPAADVDPMAAESAKRRDDYLDRLTVSTEEDITAIEKAAIKAEETGDMLPADVHAVTSECGRRFAELRGGE